MNFSEALISLKQGNRLVNRRWTEKHKYIDMFIDEQHPSVCPSILMSTVKGELVLWNPSTLDLFSEEWEII